MEKVIINILLVLITNKRKTLSITNNLAVIIITSQSAIMCAIQAINSSTIQTFRSI